MFKRRKRPTRRFQPDFLKFMELDGGMPPRISVADWCDDNGLRFMQTKAYGPICEGLEGKPAHLRLIVRYLVDPSNRRTPEGQSLQKYLRLRNFPNPESATEDAVYDLVTVGDDLEHEGWYEGILYRVFTHSIADPVSHVELFGEDEEEAVREAIGWVPIEAARQLTTPDLDPEKAKRVDLALMHCTSEEYQDCIAQLWKVNRWCVVKSKNGDVTTGVTIGLPVTPEFYHYCRGGGSITYRCPPEHILPRSRYIIVEGMAPVAHAPLSKRRPGLSLVMATVCQQARLSDLKGCPEENPLHLLTFMATPVGTERAQRFGYQPTRTQMKDTKIEFMERLLDINRKGRLDSAIIGLWKGVQAELRERFQPEQELKVQVRATQPLARSDGGLPTTC